MKSIFIKYNIGLLLGLLLFFVPFFWLDPPRMDLGGDASRIYFYDPLSYLENYAFYGVETRSIGKLQTNYYNIPVIFFLFIVKQIVGSGTFTVAVINGIKLSLGFYSLYLTSKLLLQSKNSSSEIAAVLAGLIYITFPFFRPDWDRSLLTHNQIFLHPLLIFLLLQFFLTKKLIYMWGILLITFIFSHNFSWAASPSFFSFYPLGFVFVYTYVRFVRHIDIRIRDLIVPVSLFILLQLFHIISSIIQLTDTSSNLNTRVFDAGDRQSQIDYLHALLPLSSVHRYLFMNPVLNPSWSLIIIPLFLMAGVLFIKKELRRVMLMLLSFMLVVLYLMTVDVGYIGVQIFEYLLISVPGFAMFRNFITQFLTVFIFFYSLLFSVAIYSLFQRSPRMIKIVMMIIVTLSITINGYALFSGSYVDRKLSFAPPISNNVSLQGDFSDIVDQIRMLPSDGRVLSLPFTDYDYIVYLDENRGGYVGADPIGYLTGRATFTGYFHTEPFSDTFLDLAQKKDYTSLQKLFGLLHIEYVLLNTDRRINPSVFKTYPFEYMRPYLPGSVSEYKEFIQNLSGTKIYQNGSYTLFRLKSPYSSSRLYSPEKFFVYTELESPAFGEKTGFFVGREAFDAFIDNEDCQKLTFCQNSQSIRSVQVRYEKKSQSEYILNVRSHTEPFVLIFSQAFHKKWELSSQDVDLDAVHFRVNGYANGWYIDGKQFPENTDIQLTLNMTGEKIFRPTFTISIITFIIIAVLFVKEVIKNITTNIKDEKKK